FDYYFGLPYSNDMGTARDGSKSNPGQPLPDPREVAARAAKALQQAPDGTGLRGYSQTPLPLLENDKVVGRVRAADQFAVTRRYTERAVAFIREQRERPFFLYLPHTAVHFPLYPSDGFRGGSPNGLVGDWVEGADWSVGQVLARLRERGLAEDRLVRFASDRGGAVDHRPHSRRLRGRKG